MSPEVGTKQEVSQCREVRQYIPKAAKEGFHQRGPRFTEAGDKKH